MYFDRSRGAVANFQKRINNAQVSDLGRLGLLVKRGFFLFLLENICMGVRFHDYS